MRGKQSVDLHGLVLKQSISGFGFGAALTSLRNIGFGAGKEIARHHTQPLAMASIAQPHKAKLLFRPIPCWLGWFGANGSRKARWTRLFEQKPWQSATKGVEINVFDRLVLAGARDPGDPRPQVLPTWIELAARYEVAPKRFDST